MQNNNKELSQSTQRTGDGRESSRTCLRCTNYTPGEEKPRNPHHKARARKAGGNLGDNKLPQAPLNYPTIQESKEPGEDRNM